MKMKRILASLIALMMLLGTMGVTVFAEGEGDNLPKANYDPFKGEELNILGTEYATLDIGGVFTVNMEGLTEKDYWEKYYDYKTDYVDFELEFDNDGTALLWGSYDEFDNGAWVPAFNYPKSELLKFKAGVPVKIMNYADEMLNAGGFLHQHFNSVATGYVGGQFKCGVMIGDMPKGTKVSLKLCIYEDAEKYENNEPQDAIVVGEYKFDYNNSKDYAIEIPFEFMNSKTIEVPVNFEKFGDLISYCATEGKMTRSSEMVPETYTIKLYNDVTVDETFSVPEGEDITIDLNGNTLNLAAGGNAIEGDIKFVNGTIDISGLHYNGDSILMVNGLDSDIAFENVLIQGDGYTSPAGFINLRCSQEDNSQNNQSVTIIDSVVSLTGEGDTNHGAFINASPAGTNAIVTIDNSSVSLKNARAGFINANVTLKNNSTYVVDGNQHAFNNLASLTIADSDVKVTNSTESGMKLGSGSVSITGDSNVVITGSANGDIIHRSTDENAQGAITVAGSASLTVENAAESVIEKTTGTIVNKAEKIAVAFKKDENDEAGRSYFIVLMGAEGKTINDFESAHFTFENGNKENIDYTITPNADLDITAVDDITNPDRISFYRNADENNTNEIVADEIILGTVRFEGYGKVNFSIKSEDAKVNATTAMDNIVDTFVPTSDINKLYVNWADADTADDYVPSITDELKEATRSLNVKLSFNNDVAKTNDACYNDMTVTVTGTNGYIKTGKVGSECAEAPADVYAQVGDDNVATLVFTGENALPAGYRYTVKVEGAGYRTAEYTTVVGADSTEDVTLTFWNNVKDEFNKTEIESGSDRWYTKNFLAGEIVQDNKINKYDLAAVVSYFGEDKLVENRPEYNKYDLNRDGVIDSEDIAYVLVSFGE